MKIIELKLLPGDENQKGEMDYARMLERITEMPLDPRQGLTIDEVRKANRVLDALKDLNVGDELELEDADYSHLRQKVDNFKWAVAHKNIETFVDDVKHAESRKPKEEKKDE